MLEFLKIRDVKDPIRDEKENAGIDFFIPEYSEEYILDLKNKNPDTNITSEYIEINPHCSVLIPAGIKSKFDSNLALVACNKSGICTKTQLIKGAQVIDCSYQGEWILHLINTGNNSVRLTYGTKLIQFVPVYIYDKKFVISENMSEDEFFTEKTNRGDNGFGSTGN